MTAQPKPALSYEAAYRRLEEAVADLSAGGLSLEEALARFEQGMALANVCSTLLDQAELRVQQVGQLAPAELDALLGDDGTASSPAPATGAASSAATAGSVPSTAATQTSDLRPQTSPLAGPLPGGRRGLPATTGPARKPAADAPLDPLFDDF
ncbi:MAG: exodeoxyribonuclease VII small subunit [Chloroflexota bacterium]|nr:exodeoxyribonuclease VII small subunit [Chloroflexota bacterium]